MRTSLAAAVCFVSIECAATSEAAADDSKTVGTNPSSFIEPNNSQLQEVVVTGSLIPQTQRETAAPLTVITLDEIQTKGFATVADALQHLSFATGAVQGPQNAGGFTEGAQTLSLFGLSPSYTKYLIDGRPIADYPALYNGTDVIVSLTGIPTLLVDSIDVLPGGQSSIYGSDAIAGVVNIKLKKKIEGIEADTRYGWTNDGGGGERRLSLADGFDLGPVNLLVGGQYERTDPIFGYQRPLTRRYFVGGTSPQTAERDFLVLDANGTTYFFEDPAHCANVTGLFHGSLEQAMRPGHGTYCGTTTAGYYSINNGTESTQGYLRTTDDINNHVQIFGEVLLSHDVQRFSAGANFFETYADPSSPYYYYYDPNIGDEVNLQRFFSVEEAGGIGNTLNKNTNNSLRGTLGLQGSVGASTWQYLLDMTYTENKLTELTHVGTEAGLNRFFSKIFGPKLGDSPFGDGDGVYAPNYPAFYRPVSPAEYAAFSAYLASYSRTEESLARGRVTNSALFNLPGGNAGIALQVEGGDEGWDYVPDPGFLNGAAYLYTATAGSGHRSRTAETAELRLPIVNMLTLDLSARYDDYKVSGASVAKGTYNFAIEFRPVHSLLIRGRYGTAFKVPTLSDEFQALSGFFTTVTDYYQCEKQGFTVGNIGQCSLSGVGVFGTTQGNPGLQPINAKIVDGGIVWSPVEGTSLTVDYVHWNISNEVEQQDSDQLLRTEAACRLGQLNINSPTCVQTLSQVTRDNNGNLIKISIPKINVAQELLNVLVFGGNYTWATNRGGQFVFQAAYSDILRHQFIQFPGDMPIDYLNSPFYSTEFRTKENLSATWNFAKFGMTVYIERYGKTPNNLAQLAPQGYATPGAAALGTLTIANWSARYEVLQRLNISANIVNVFNRMPPIDLSYPGTAAQPYNVFNYNVYGRAYFVEANYRYGK